MARPLEDCAREVGNWAKIEFKDRFDKPQFDPVQLIKKMPLYSPTMFELLDTLDKLDERDMNISKTLYKHFIFSDIKRGAGAKILTSAFIARGYNLAIKHKGSKLFIDENVLNNGSPNNFAVLSSTAFWNITFTLNLVKEIIALYNNRADNVYGSKIRFIILDSSFKEGIDLFDVKYGHIFEEQRTDADITQAVGRMTRYCGQSGLPYIKNEGWKIYLYNYKLYKLRSTRFVSQKETLLSRIYRENKNIQYNVNFKNDLMSIAKDVAVDKELNSIVSKYEKQTYWRRILATASIAAAATLLGTGYYIYKNKKVDDKKVDVLTMDDISSIIDSPSSGALSMDASWWNPSPTDTLWGDSTPP